MKRRKFYKKEDSKGRMVTHPITAKKSGYSQPSMKMVKTEHKLQWEKDRFYTFRFKYSDGSHETVVVSADDPEEALRKAMNKRKEKGKIPVSSKMKNQAELLLMQMAMEKGQQQAEDYERKRFESAERKFRRKAKMIIIDDKVRAYMKAKGTAWTPSESEHPELYKVSEKEIREEFKRNGWDVYLSRKKKQSEEAIRKRRKQFGTMKKEVARDIQREETTTESGFPKSQHSEELGNIPWWSNAYEE